MLSLFITRSVIEDIQYELKLNVYVRDTAHRIAFHLQSYETPLRKITYL